MSVCCNRAERIEHRRLKVWQSADDTVGSSPNPCFQPVQDSCQQGRCTHHHCELSRWAAVLHPVVVNLDGFLAYEPETYDMDDYCQHDQGATPCPVGVPGRMIF